MHHNNILGGGGGQNSPLTPLLQQGDCLELMQELPDKSIDMILCDLPFGTTRNKWDSVIPLEPLWEQYNRLIKDHGAICLFSQVPFSSVLGTSNLKMLRYEWIWQKSKATGHLNANRMPLKKHENILVFYKHLPTYHPQFTEGKPYKGFSGAHSSNYGKYHSMYNENDGYRYPVDVQNFTSISNTVHPTQKPVELLEYLIKTYTNPGETVLDNCMGSGSTGVATINTGRKFIGMELDQHYFDIATERIRNAISATKEVA